PDHELVKQSLREVGFGQIQSGTGEVSVVPEEGIDLLASYVGQASLLKEWLRGAQINTHRNLRLQYLPVLGLNSFLVAPILCSIVADYRFPDQTFAGSPESLNALKHALERRSTWCRSWEPGTGTPPVMEMGSGFGGRRN